MYTQVRTFDPNKGGNVPNLCLDNVRRGYGIANKYTSAWQAWEHTEQHPDRDIPAGVDVPLYYSYTVTLDGVTQNYGHINVRLANGTVWSDGAIYHSLEDYLSKKLPKYVGWGESVNDFKVIQGETMPDDYLANDGDNDNVKKEFGFSPSDPPNLAGQPWKSVYYNWINGKGKAMQAQIDDLKKQLAAEYVQVGTIDGEPIYKKKG